MLGYVDFMKGEYSSSTIPTKNNILSIVKFASPEYISNNSDKICEIIEKFNVADL